MTYNMRVTQIILTPKMIYMYPLPFRDANECRHLTEDSELLCGNVET